MQLSARLLALLAVTAVAGFGAAFAVARSGADDGTGQVAAPTPTTLPTVDVTAVDQTVRAVGEAVALPHLRRRPRTPTDHTVPTTTSPPTVTTVPPPTVTTQPPTTTQVRPPPTTTQSAPPVTTQSG